MVERVKELKKQKVRHEGDALLAKQDFIGFSKASGAGAAEKMMMEYDYVAEEADQLRADLITGRVANPTGNVADVEDEAMMNSEDLEALEEEEKLV